MLTDKSLVLQLQHGSVHALGVLYDRHQNMVYRTALAITGDAEAAADLLQDTFLRLYRFADKIDPDRPLEPWLYRIVANLSYTWVKRHNRFVRSIEDVASWLGGNKKDSPASKAEEKETWLVLRQAILSLPVAQRVVVVLYYINDLSLQEIAEVLNVPEGTVKSRLFYGRQALRRYFELDGTVDLREVVYEFT